MAFRPDPESRAARRLRGFRLHLTGYVIVVILLAAMNYVFTPGRWWFVFFMVAWGAPLAIHVAWVMGLFGGTGDG